MTTVTITPSGPFSLAASVRFLEGFTPASYDDAADGTLRLAFPADDGHATVAAAVRQDEPTDDGAGAVRVDFAVQSDGGEEPSTEAVRNQIARILSLDVDGAGFPALATDPVVAGLMADYAGLRPVCFYSPYEAAAWAIIGQRVRMTQAAAVKAHIAERHGSPVRVAGRTLHAFPGPQALLELTHVPGLTDVKVERLHALADAAADGELDAAKLRAKPVDDALTALRAVPGIGPFSAELVLIRGAGHPDVFPLHERRLHASMADEYGLDTSEADDVPRLAGIADRWRPYRSWVALLLRARAEDRGAAHH
ncbi:Fe-S cluster assembly protein HesB [Actinomadura sp. CNU-125]|uniref:DNA-3-methyladenine glycosylase family protein n=1 Tax=Actinomadura sp. CNU-125 TaxID=1904961 RepID=UPI00095BCCFA|nr:DNA-3-methyladenine glycosylase [Actinomadura sp. CNU-125]OLT30734.1 Fe-S cluster assembly protein HesB [Actinomadura sp. CNU-125]